MKSTTSLINHDSQRLIANTHDGHTKPSAPPVFILCDRCYWCATYFTNTGIPMDNNCPQCNANSNKLTSFLIASNESFTYNYNDKRVVYGCNRSYYNDNNRIVKLPDRVADTDKYEYAYDYNYY